MLDRRHSKQKPWSWVCQTAFQKLCATRVKRSDKIKLGVFLQNSNCVCESALLKKVVTHADTGIASDPTQKQSSQHGLEPRNFLLWGISADRLPLFSFLQSYWLEETFPLLVRAFHFSDHNTGHLACTPGWIYCLNVATVQKHFTYTSMNHICSSFSAHCIYLFNLFASIPPLYNPDCAYINSVFSCLYLIYGISLFLVNTEFQNPTLWNEHRGGNTLNQQRSNLFVD